MEIIFLLVGLPFIAVGAIITLFEVRARNGTTPLTARVIGFSTGRSNTPNSPSFHSVAHYVGPNGRDYYLESAVGSSALLHAVGDSVTVLVNPAQPEKAVLKSALSFVIGIALALMGLAFVIVFWLAFQASVYSIAMAALVVGAFVLKIKKEWRKKPFTLETWREYKKEALSPRVFTDESKNQICWADPIGVAAAIRSYEKSVTVGTPLLLVVGFGLVFFSHHFYKRTTTFLEKANHASGQVVDLRESESTDATTYAAVVEFIDERRQKHEFVDSFSSSPPSYRTGQTVGVLYNRENPGEAQIDRGRMNYWLAFLFGSVGTLFTTAGVFTARNHLRRRRNALRFRKPVC